MGPQITFSGDDWTKATDPRERKRIQDRLAKRLSRQRKRDLEAGGAKSGPVSPTRGGRGSSHSTTSSPGKDASQQRTRVPHITSIPSSPAGMLSPVSMTPWGDIAMSSSNELAGSVASQPKLDPDQEAFYLNIGVQTVIKALQANTSNTFSARCANSNLEPIVLNQSIGFSAGPPLAPTRLQSEAPNMAFVAALPFCGLREAILRAMPYIDYAELWRDSVGGGFFVWGDAPWLAQSWEVTEEWATKWWFLLDREVVDTANFWRVQRGLPRLREPAEDTMLAWQWPELTPQSPAF